MQCPHILLSSQHHCLLFFYHLRPGRCHPLAGFAGLFRVRPRKLRVRLSQSHSFIQNSRVRLVSPGPQSEQLIPMDDGLFSCLLSPRWLGPSWLPDSASTSRSRAPPTLVSLLSSSSCSAPSTLQAKVPFRLLTPQRSSPFLTERSAWPSLLRPTCSGLRLFP